MVRDRANVKIYIFTKMYERFSLSFANFNTYSNLPYLSPYINFVYILVIKSTSSAIFKSAK